MNDESFQETDLMSTSQMLPAQSLERADLSPVMAAACMMLNWGDLGRGRWRLWKNVLIFLFGLGGMVLGAYVSTVNIVKKFQEEHEQ